MAHEYTAAELWAKLRDPSARFYLVDTLPRAAWLHRHLPGALSLPLEEVATRAAQVLPERDLEVIAYCSGPT